MKLWSDSFKDGDTIPTEFVFGKPHPENHVQIADNRNPHFDWSELPEGTKSLVLICHDTEVPRVGDDVNQVGKTVPFDLPRVDFYHWTLVDLPAKGPIEAGSHSGHVTAGGKDGPIGPFETRHGLNDYTGWFDGDASMGGLYYGYDGPGPPWNDERLHRYVFTLYAIDQDKCSVKGDKFTGPDALKAIEGHVLGKAVMHATYAIFSEAR